MLSARNENHTMRIFNWEMWPCLEGQVSLKKVIFKQRAERYIEDD